MTSRQQSVHVGRAWRLMLRDFGLDETAVLRRAGLPPGLLAGDGSHISLDEYYALHEATQEESGDPCLALWAGKLVSVELFDPALFAAICSPDMNTAASRLGEFKRLVGPFSLDVDVGADETRIVFRCKRRPDVPMSLGLSEAVFLVAFARRATRHRIEPRAVRVQTLPSELQPYERYLGCRLEEGDQCTVVFDAEDACRPLLTHNAPMWKALEPSLRQRMSDAREAQRLTEQVESALHRLLPSGRTQMSDLAKELGVGARTLQRRLAAENTTWLAVLNQTRERLACHYLARTKMSPAEISFLLGFEDPNSLYRAFHRWTGTTPESWRMSGRGRPM